MSSPEIAGTRLAVEHAATAAAALLAGHGIASVALRGPALVRLLYDDAEARASLDVDLLVPELAAASTALVGQGYEIVVDWTPGMERHAWTHVKANAVSVDLHRTLVGIDGDDSTVWTVLHRESVPVELTGGVVLAPGAGAQALCVALHAAQHGSDSEQPLRDLAHGLARFDGPTWERAAALAAELEAVPAFAAGLRQLPAGAALADELELPLGRSRREELRAAYGTSEPAVLGLDTFLTLRGRSRLVFARGKLFPPTAFMRDRYPLARRGALGLGAAYAYRAGWLAWWLPTGLRRVRAASRLRE